VYISSHSKKTGKDGAVAAQKKAQVELDERHRQHLDKEVVGVGGFSDHIDDFIKYCEKRKLSEGTIKFYKQKLDFLKGKLGRAHFKDLDRNRVRLAIKSAGNGPTWEKGILGALSAYMNWGYSRPTSLCPPSFTKFIDLENPVQPAHKNYYTVEEARALMNYCANDGRRHMMALRLYAGFRTEEINRLRWDYFDFSSRTIFVPRYNPLTGKGVGKTAGNMEHLPDILWHWIEGAPKTGKVYEGDASYVVNNIKRFIKETKGVKGATTRRTFATFASNAFGVEQTRKWMRHSEKLDTLERKYIGCVTYRGDAPYIATDKVSKSYFEC